jgi:hypothetical protein
VSLDISSKICLIFCRQISIRILIASSQGDLVLDFNQSCCLPSSQPWWRILRLSGREMLSHPWFCYSLDQSRLCFDQTAPIFLLSSRFTHENRWP